MTVWRPGDGFWYALRSSSANQTFLAREWGSGLSADVPVPGDYDGDGRRDLAVWRPENGVWYVLKSSANYRDHQAMTVAWGLGQAVAIGADVPVPGDYDGDGRTDPAVWRPDSGTWYILRSSKNYSYADAWVVPWGASSLADTPVPADYDGDGRTDIAVWRPGSGIWFILKSTANYAYADALTLHWGAGAWNDRPVVGDYDGDGRADAAVWRPNPGVWYILKSSQNYSSAASTVIEWGAGWLGDIPVVGDYDGDGSSDLTVWRPGSGGWYILKSSAVYGDWSLIEWGAGSLNDIPNTQ